MCELMNYLSKLKKSSVEAVDSSDSFSDFQKYMHVKREAEEELEFILKDVQTKKKVLVLLCGSVGDGKSHILGYFKNQTNLLEGFRIINDATESSYPDKTSQECLSKELIEFSDENIENDVSKKVIVAINLGTLSNFLNSEHGQQYKKLAEYVFSAGVIADKECCVTENEYFRSINFADYQLFELAENGVKSEFLFSLFNKIFDQVENNPFYQASKKCSGICKDKCPIFANFQLMSNIKIRSSVVELLINCIISEKMILSTRLILNFIYDILVAPEYESLDNVGASVGNIKLKTYVDNTLPNLLFSSMDRSPILNAVSKLDPVKKRRLGQDEEAIKYNYVDDGRTLIKTIEGKVELNSYLNYIRSFEEKKQLLFEKTKMALFKLNTRQAYLEKMTLNKTAVLKDFLNAVFCYNTGKRRGLSDVSQKLKSAVYGWNGVIKDERVIIPKSTSKYTVSQKIDIKPDLSRLPETKNISSLSKFKNYIVLGFTVGSRHERIAISIDFKLYELIGKISNGYRPTISDKNVFINFDEFVRKVSKNGELEKSVYISDNSSGGKTYHVELSEFGGYTFREI